MTRNKRRALPCRMSSWKTLIHPSNHTWVLLTLSAVYYSDSYSFIYTLMNNDWIMIFLFCVSFCFCEPFRCRDKVLPISNFLAPSTESGTIIRAGPNMPIRSQAATLRGRCHHCLTTERENACTQEYRWLALCSWQILPGFRRTRLELTKQTPTLISMRPHGEEYTMQQTHGAWELPLSRRQGAAPWLLSERLRGQVGATEGKQQHVLNGENRKVSRGVFHSNQTPKRRDCLNSMGVPKHTDF